MRLPRRRAVPARTRARSGAAAPAHRADWRTIVARASASAAPDPAAPAPPPPRPSGRGGAVALVGLALGVTMTAQAAALVTLRPPVTFAGPAVEPPVTAPGPAAVARTVPPRKRAALPASVRIARIGVSSPLVGLKVQRDGALQVPEDYARAGWWSQGVRPGENGPAVVVGHVDSTSGPAVFFRLRELRPGDVVEVARADRTVVRYAVRSVRQYPKTRFPTEAVYGATRGPSLRLVTCGGSFDRRRGSYRDNVVVFADLLVPPTRKAVS